MNKTNFKKLSRYKLLLVTVIFTCILSSCQHSLNGVYVNGSSAIQIESMGDGGFSVQMSKDLTNELGITTILATNEKASEVVGGFHYGANKNELVFDRNIDLKLTVQSNTIVFQNRVFRRD